MALNIQPIDMHDRMLEEMNAHRESCGLVVVGARGMGHVKGALLGSVRHRVANTAQASVLVVRGEDG